MSGILEQSVSPKPVYWSLYKTSINVGFFYFLQEGQHQLITGSSAVCGTQMRCIA